MDTLTPIFLILTFVSFSSDIGDAANALGVFCLIMFITAITVAVVYGSQATGPVISFRK